MKGLMYSPAPVGEPFERGWWLPWMLDVVESAWRLTNSCAFTPRGRSKTAEHGHCGVIPRRCGSSPSSCNDGADIDRLLEADVATEGGNGLRDNIGAPIAL
mmetsp:Transcript_44097/g.122675  ORF Transcript_44097/g.122675 Transcript_44097/m.122675 type:complete len:101 (-) Transcript_44097:237-539(-)